MATKIKWSNEKLVLCVICDKPLLSSSYWTCLKCSKPTEFTRKHISGDTYDLKSTCCNYDIMNNQSITCSVECHNELVESLIKENGKYKLVTNAETGKTHKVPTRDIIEFGINFADLEKYPTVENKN